MKSKLNLQLLNKKEELRKLDLFQEIHDLEISIKQLEKQDEEIREQGKQILLNA
jgi:predicted ATP-grasp superfamily ATP-dependent carboligase